MCNAYVQTDGLLLPYPPDSTWIQSRGRGHSVAAEESIIPIDANSRHAKDALSKPDENSRLSTSTLHNVQLGPAPSSSIADPLAAKQPAGRKHRRKSRSLVVGSGRYVSQRVAPGDYLSNTDETTIDGNFSIKGQSITSARNFDKRAPTEVVTLSIPNQFVPDDDDDAVSSISVLTVSPRN